MKKENLVVRRTVDNIGMTGQELTFIFPFIGAKKVTIENAYVVNHFNLDGIEKASTIVFETNKGTYVLDFDKVKMYPVMENGEYAYEDICIVSSELLLNYEDNYYYTESTDTDLIDFDEDGVYFFDREFLEVL